MAKLERFLILTAFGVTAASIVTVGLIAFATIGFGLVHLIPAIFAHVFA